MNILFLSTHLNTGGITSYLFTLAKGLIQRGHSVHVVSSGGNNEKAFEAIGANIKVLNIRTKSELSPKVYLALNPLRQYMRDHRIDIIHAQTRVTQVMGALLKKTTGRAYLSTCHGFFKVKLSRTWFPCWGDAVIAISGQVQSHLRDDFHVSRDKIHMISNGIDLTEFHETSSTNRFNLRKRFNLADEPVFGMIARLSEVKGPDILIEAFKRILAEVPQAKLVLVGEGKMANVLHAMVERLGLKNHVYFFSIVNRTSEILPIFDIFVMPSRQEGLGLSIMEAQAAGLPVVATRVGGIPSLINDGQSGILVEPNNSEVLAEAVIRLWKDAGLRLTIGRAGQESIRKNHSADQMVERTARLYQKLLTDSK